ncbi:MAG: AAA domain-containing protein [Exilibacterium sp.]
MSSFESSEQSLVDLRLNELLEYVHHLGQLDLEPVFTVDEYNQLQYSEHQLRDRIGITINTAGLNGEPVWLQVERLKRVNPPELPADLQYWVTLSHDPQQPPTIKNERILTVTEAQVEELIAEGKLETSDIHTPLRKSAHQLGKKDVLLRLSRFPEIQQSIDKYLAEQWALWSEEEIPRRETIAIYDALFNLSQMLEAQGDEQPLELVWGMGVARWHHDSTTIDHPLLEKVVEIDIDKQDGSLKIRPRRIAPEFAFGPYMALDILSTDTLKRFAKQYFIEQGEDDKLSPFVPETYDTVLRQAATQLSESGIYWPNNNPDARDRKPPPIKPYLIVSDCWILFARPRSQTSFIQDVELFRQLVKQQGTTLLPAPVKRIVIELSDQKPSVDLGQEHFSSPEVVIDGDADTREIFFPKPYNDAQLQIIQKLEDNDGAVVQGPPGTGKTHTIANIICHYLATGRTVLVTSKAEAALSVIREQIPEEVRDLTISLLNNEHIGVKQLESAVRLLASIVNQTNPSDLKKSITNDEQRVKQLRFEITAIDTELMQWGELQLNPIDATLVAEDKNVITAMELAEYIVAGKAQHMWFPDVLKFDSEQHQPQFNGEDIASLREARKVLGDDILHVDKVLPEANELPAAELLCHIHEDLLFARQLRDQAKTDKLPQLAEIEPNAVKRARALLPGLQKLRELIESLSDTSWLRNYFVRLIVKRGEYEHDSLLEELLPQLKSLSSLRSNFVRTPVSFPYPGKLRSEVDMALNRLRTGGKAFSLFSFGKRGVRDLLDLAEVAGSPPNSRERWQHVIEYLDFQDEAKRFVVSWNSVGDDLGQRAVVADGTCQDIGDVVLFAGIHDAVVDSHGLDRLLDGAGHFLQKVVGNARHSKSEVSKLWQYLLGELERLHSLRPQMQLVSQVLEKIRRSGAPRWASLLAQPQQIDEVDLTPDYWYESWCWQKQKNYLQSIDSQERVKTLSQNRLVLDNNLKRAYSNLVKHRTFLGLHANMSERVQSSLQRFISAVTKMGKTNDKRSSRHRSDAASAMRDCYGGVPCWIMPSWRISENIPAEFGSFDLVIVDEASQSDISALPAILRAKKILIVGDDKQVSPTAGALQEEKMLQLKHNFLKHQPYQELLLPGNSLYDLATAIFPSQRIMLTEHFRCVEPIIRFSTQFYNEPLVPLRVPKTSERITPPLVDIYVADGSRDEWLNINRNEINAVVDEVKNIVSDPDLFGRSIGIISLFGAQQAYAIQERLLAEIGEEVYLRCNITCGDSVAFQGKERDIILLTMVVGPGQGAPMNKRENEQRFNVAMSRARDRMYLVRSVTQEDLRSEDDLRLRVLRHFAEPMPIQQTQREALSLCDTEFEREIYTWLQSQGYQVTPKVKVGPYTIDLVVEGANDRRLALKLDGDQYQPPEQWAGEFSQQRTMERVGWVFWRCWGASYKLDAQSCIDDLQKTLNDMGINPVDLVKGPTVYTCYREYNPPQASDVEAPNYNKPPETELVLLPSSGGISAVPRFGEN